MARVEEGVSELGCSSGRYSRFSSRLVEELPDGYAVKRERTCQQTLGRDPTFPSPKKGEGARAGFRGESRPP